MQTKGRLSIAAALAATAFLFPAPACFAQAKVQAHDTSIDGITAEVEAVRKEGVLTVKVRYKNAGDAPAKVRIYRDWNDTEYYLTSGNTKLMVLKDSKNVAIATPHGQHGETHAEIKPKGSYLFWAKYPAPPGDPKKVSFYHPHGPPIEDVPVTDAQ